jgi:hypothetical protein
MMAKIDAEILRRKRARVILELEIWVFGAVSGLMIVLILWAIGTS